MGAKKTDISQIDKYLKGELDAKAMHQMERAAQDDPFLMDALEGFEKAGTDQQANLTDLQARLADRVAKKEGRSILLWRVLPMAACLLLMLGGGYWFINRQPAKKQYADNIAVEKPKQGKLPSLIMAKPDSFRDHSEPKNELSTPSAPKKAYIAKNDAQKDTRSIEDILKKKAADTNSTLSKNALVARLNSKELNGGLANEALKKSPMGLAEQTIAIDNYSNVGKTNPAPKVYGRSKPAIGLQPSYTQGKFGPLITALPPKPPAEAPLPPGKVMITGVVLDAATKEPLTGTTIGTVNGGGITQADINGKYKVIVDEGAILSYQFVSYASQSHKLVAGESTVNINLNTDTKQASEVVIRGYVKRDREVTSGSSYIITGREVKDNPVGNVEQLLQGKVAGLNIQNDTGAPGMRGSVNIRGLSAPPPFTDPSAMPYVMSVTVVDDKGAAALNATAIIDDWSGKVDNRGKFENIGLGPTVVGFSMPGYVSRFVKFNKKDSIVIALKKLKKTACNENLEFKKQFEQNIGIAQKFTVGRYVGRTVPITPEEFNAAIKFIARYTKVSIGTKANARYKDLDAFMADKVKWLTWYEAKKCKGLK